MSERVGFIGLGIMGQGMARNLLKAGFNVSVWNRTASKADALVAEGAQVVEGTASELDGLGIRHGGTIQIFVCLCQLIEMGSSGQSASPRARRRPKPWPK